jgi:zinc protease
MSRILFLAVAAGLTGCGASRQENGPPQAGAAPAGSQAASVNRFQLANGLVVLLHPVRGAQQVAIVVLYNLGGRSDPPGRSGLGHLVEHVYVTAAAGDSEARTADEAMGRSGNAQTGEDYTVIAEAFPVGELEGKLVDAAARMGSLRVGASDLERERPRLLAEVENMFGGMPSLGAWNLARERVRPSPAGGRRGGLPAQVAAITPREVHDRWRRFYKPGNALLILAGGFDAGKARASIEKQFGRLPTGEPPPRPLALGTPHLGDVARVAVTSNVPGGSSEACLMYAAPSPGSDLYAPFLVLVARMQGRMSQIGDVGAQGRFPPPVYYAVLDDPSVFSVSAPVGAGETGEGVIAKLDAFISGSLKPELAPSDIRAAEDHFGPFLGLAEVPDSFWAQNPYGLAFSLGRRAQLGIDPAKLKRTLAGLTEADLRRCAREVFGPERRAAVIVTAQ